MLNAAALLNGILGVFDKKLPNIADVAQQISEQYRKYASIAQGSTLMDPVVLLGAEQLKLQQALVNLMQARLPAAAAANMVGTAIVQFWTAPPVLTVGAGTCTVVIPAGGISIMMGTKVSTSAQAAQSLANALDAMTRTTTIIYPYPIVPGVLV